MSHFQKNSPFTLLAVLALFLGVALISQSLAQSSSTNPTKAKIDFKKEKIVSASNANIKSILSLAGKVDADTYAAVQFQTSGQLAWVGVKEGDKVKKGQALASLNKDQLKKQFQKQMNDYLTNRWNFEDTQDKYKTTKDDYLVTDEIQRILDRQQFSLNNAVLDVEIADLTMKYATIYSPIDGIVVAIDQKNPGVNITPASATFTVIDPQSVYFKSKVDETDINHLHLDETAEISLDSFADKSIDSKITYMSFTPVDGETSTVYTVKFSLPVDNTNSAYRLGMNGNVAVTTNQADNVLTIPIEGLYEENGQKFVYKTDSTKKEKIKTNVTTGIESDTQVQIIDGLKAGESVVIPITT